MPSPAIGVRPRWNSAVRRVRSGNSLTAGLVGLIPFDRIPAVDVSNGLVCQTSGSPTLAAATPRGAGVDMVASVRKGFTRSVPAGDPLRLTSAPVSVFWAGYQQMTPTSSAPYFAVFPNNSDSFPYVTFGVGVNASPNYNFYYGTNSAIVEAATTVSASTYRGYLSLCVTITASTLLGFVNGQQLSSASGPSGTGFAYTATSELVAGAMTGQNRGCGAIALLGAVWSRALSASEIAMLHDDPWRLVS